MYPDFFQRDNNTKPEQIVRQSLAEMQKKLTPDIRAAFAKQGLTTYQGLILASIIEKEVSNLSDRPIVAQVFLKRKNMDMMLGSDVTAIYGAIMAGQPGNNSAVDYDSPYNTRMHTGLPPTPIGTMDKTAIAAVANPAKTDWLYFVTGDDKVTYFSKTLEEHEALTKQHCIELCK